MALFYQMASVSWEDIACSCVRWQECKAKRERKCGLTAPHPTNVPYLWELMSDGLTWAHPWQIEMTPQTFPESKPSKMSAFHFSQPKKYFRKRKFYHFEYLWFDVGWLQNSVVAMWRSSWFELFCGNNTCREMSWMCGYKTGLEQKSL